MSESDRQSTFYVLGGALAAACGAVVLFTQCTGGFWLAIGGVLLVSGTCQATLGVAFVACKKLISSEEAKWTKR